LIPSLARHIVMKEAAKAQPEASVPLPPAPTPALALAPTPTPALVASTETLESLADDVGSLWASSRIPVLEEPPSSLEFLRDFVSKSRPCIIQHSILAKNDNVENDDDAGRRGPPLLLSLDDLVARMEGVDVLLDVNATPDGHGDCLRRVAVPATRTNRSTNTAGDGNDEGASDQSSIIEIFVEPEVRKMSFPRFRDRLRTKRKSGRVDDENVAERIFHPTSIEKAGDAENNSENDDDDDDAVLYYSVQNDCLRADLPSLWDAGIFPASFNWAEQAFGVGPPDAVNLWVGNELGVSSMHKDHYENLFYVLSGEKVFTVCPPADAPFLYERECPAGIFVSSTKNGGGSGWRVQQQQQQQEEGRTDDGETQSTPATVRWIAANVQHKNDDQHLADYPLLAYTHPITITVRAGEMLYLPALWFHSVTQTKETVAINYWYDMKFDSPAWCYFHFLSQLQPSPAPPSPPSASIHPNTVP
jgi:jumonji domain-containing protein 7